MPRRTCQGNAVRTVLRAAERPLTPAEIHVFASKQLPSLGLATTYRHVRALAKEGCLVGVDYPGQPTRYEWADGRDKTHFSCRGCGKLFALDLPQTDNLPDLDLPPGYHAQGGEIILYGLCPDCSNQNE